MAKSKAASPRSSRNDASVSTSDQENMIVVLPGDDVTHHIDQICESLSIKMRKSSSQTAAHELRPSVQPKIGQGLRYAASNNHHKVFATCAGRFTYRRLVDNNVAFFVQHNLRRYRPYLEDRVVGIVEERAGSDGTGGDLYRVHIGGPHPAVLSNLSFEGATKRNKPQLQCGTLVYARVMALPHNLDPVLSCELGPRDAGLPRKDWMTNEGAYGVLEGGTCCNVSLGLARELLRPDNVVLDALTQRKSLAFELAVGVNGMLWIRSERAEHTILIQNAIANSEVLTDPQVRAMVKSLMDTIQAKIQHADDHMHDG
mmetsp:Transcript_23911/g.66826  ORF Transcript_23911/g.66826 Transcript_23911/m.66826 type:complete len:314 (-) Transcript_23911:52-993(-)|eukprot:CAMPEP_0198118682 /NCGR_PEP_ID=MMETSP1442-20131203/22717_1 /TAXON_ID= /ORGANISM="Craspedostauros australis, Strain CCMP3328" /LENGTH=313 /DNA_ID=CAMNT_0043776991 /DNA_START=96 /DNA_END=1037 /DNA_ORIENTATION=+